MLCLSERTNQVRCGFELALLGRVSRMIRRNLEICIALDHMSSTPLLDQPTPTFWTPFGARLKSSLLGGAAATLLAPVAWLVVVLFQTGLYEPLSRVTSVLMALHAILLFAALVVFPSALIFGPLLLAICSRSPQYLKRCASGLGAVLGVAVIGLLHASASPSDGSLQLPVGLALFGASIGAAGAWVAARHFQVGGSLPWSKHVG